MWQLKHLTSIISSNKDCFVFFSLNSFSFFPFDFDTFKLNQFSSCFDYWNFWSSLALIEDCTSSKVMVYSFPNNKGFLKCSYVLGKLLKRSKVLSPSSNLTSIFSRSSNNLLKYQLFHRRSWLGHSKRIQLLLQIEFVCQQLCHIQWPKLHPHWWAVFSFMTPLSVLSPRHMIMALMALLIMLVFSFRNKNTNMFTSPFRASAQPCWIKMDSILSLTTWSCSSKKNSRYQTWWSFLILLNFPFLFPQTKPCWLLNNKKARKQENIEKNTLLIKKGLYTKNSHTTIPLQRSPYAEGVIEDHSKQNNHQDTCNKHILDTRY